jgi:hypothetical protein
VEAVHQRRHQLVRALLGLEGGGALVVHAVHGRRVLGEPVAGAQQLEEAVGPVMDEGTEHADPVDLPGEEFHDPQLDDLAAVAAVDTGHVHAARHACSPFPRGTPCETTLSDGYRFVHKNRPPR